MTIQPPENVKGTIGLVAGVLHLGCAPGSVVGESDAHAVMAKVAALCSGHKYPLLVDMAGMTWIDRAARNVFAAWPLARMAIVGASPVDEVMVRFYMARHSPACPTRYFTCFDEARTWLAGVENHADAALTPPQDAAPA